MKLDAEILRAKELQAGYDSEMLIQSPPRSHDGVLWQYKVHRWLNRLAQDVKEESALKHHE